MFISFFLPSTFDAVDERTVIINEINWAGSSRSTADEWLELKNITDGAINIGGWKLQGAASGTSVLTIPAGSSIPPGSFFLISNFTHTDARSTLNVLPDWQTSSLSLRNSNLKVVLTDAAGATIDDADDGAGSPFAGDNTKKASMERNRLLQRGDTATSWHSAAGTVNFDAGISQFGTPKAENNAAPVITVGRVTPSRTASGQKNQFSIDYDVHDPDGQNDIVSALLDLSDLGGGQLLLDIQSANAKYVIEPPSLGSRKWSITATDVQGAISFFSQTLSVFQDGAAVKISEINPAPQEGSNFEWIELYNQSVHPIDLGNFQLDDISDGGSSPYPFPVGTTIGAQSYLVIEKSVSNLALNDDGDIVQLFGPDGSRIDTTPNWGKATKGQSFAFIDGTWQWTTQITKAATNLPTPPVAQPAASPAPAQTREVSPTPATASETPSPISEPSAESAVAVAKPVVQSVEQVVAHSQKRVKGIKITTASPAPRPANNHLPVVGGAGGLLAMQEFLAQWLRKQLQRNKQSNLARKLASAS